MKKSALSQFAHLGCCTSSLASLPLHLISVIAASSPTLLVRHLAATTVALSNYLDYFCSLSSIFEKKLRVIGTVDPVNQPEKPKEEPKNEEPKKKEESKKEEPKKEPKKEEEKKEEEKKQEAAPAPVPPSDPILELVKAYRAYSANCARYTFILQKLSQYPKICFCQNFHRYPLKTNRKLLSYHHFKTF
ncbi:Heavy metal-associated isoprenylated plant protein 39 [Citrus sinensis]|nr:Heavy metal-associated isoprenylated plant protein 39 [Citrus sinensis]